MGVRNGVGDPVRGCVGLPFTIGIVTIFPSNVSHLALQCLVQHMDIASQPLCLEMHALTLILSRWTSLPVTSPSHPHPNLVCVNRQDVS